MQPILAHLIHNLLQNPFGEIAALLLIASVVGFLGQMLKQPLIVSFIAVGLLVGPSALNVVHSPERITLLSELGIAVLLFLVGIKLDVKLIRSLGVVSFLTGLGQVIFTSFFGYLIGLALGLPPLTSLYVAVALTFSSTIIIVKLLADKREIDSLHGQIALGFLIVQDLVVVFAMIVLSAMGVSGGHESSGDRSLLTTLLAGLGLITFVVLFIRYLANPLTDKLARTPELLVVFSISFAAIFAAVGDLSGLGKEVGGLLAGVSLASIPYRETIAARLAPLRDFLLLFFFISLGSTLEFSYLGNQTGAALVFSLFILIGNPLIVLAIMGAMGYRKRTSFLAGLTVAQISEFSLIFIGMGVTLGHLQKETLGLVTLVGMITIALSTYMITYSHTLYSLCAPFLDLFERKGTPSEPPEKIVSSDKAYDVIIFGLGRFGTAIGIRLKKKQVRFLGVDFNPAAVRRWRSMGFDTEYGDASDPQFISELPLLKAKWILSTVPIHPSNLNSEDPRLSLIQLGKSVGFKGKIAVTSHSHDNSQELLAAGAHLVLEPFQDAADRATDLLCGGSEEERTEIPGLES